MCQFNFQVQKRYFVLKGRTLTWQEQPETSADKSSCLEIHLETRVYFVDSSSDLFEFEIANFIPTKCGHAADKPYRLGAASSDERDMWVSQRHVNACFIRNFLCLFRSTTQPDALHSIILFGIQSFYLAFNHFIWHSIILFGIQSFFLAFNHFIWHSIILFGIQSFYLAFNHFIWHSIILFGRCSAF